MYSRSRIATALWANLTNVKEYLDQKFDSHAPIACVKNIDEAALSIDKEEETATEDKEDDLATEEAVERADTIESVNILCLHMCQLFRHHEMNGVNLIIDTGLPIFLGSNQARQKRNSCG